MELAKRYNLESNEMFISCAQTYEQQLKIIKKLQDDKNGVFLVSLNEKYSPIPVGENDRFDILGKVVGKNHPNELRDFQQ